MTPQEYLARERAAEFRSEYFRGDMFSMTRSNWTHTRIKDNLAFETSSRIQQGPCHVLTSDMRVKVETIGFYAYPDMVVVCEKPLFEDQHHDTLLNPRMVIEIMSDATEQYDRGVKFQRYRQSPSMLEYVLVAQDYPLVESYARRRDGTWLLSAFTDLKQAFTFDTIPVQIPLADIYDRVEVPENADC